MNEEEKIVDEETVENFSKEDLSNLKSKIIKGMINSADESAYTFDELINLCATAIDEEVYNYYLERLKYCFNKVDESSNIKEYKNKYFREKYQGKFSNVIEDIEFRKNKYLSTGIDPQIANETPRHRKY